MDGGLVLLKEDKDVEDMLSFAMENDNKIDVYVQHSNQEFKENFGGVNDVAEDRVSVDELDDSDFAESDYSMTDDDMLYNDNVDGGVEWVGALRAGLGLGEEVVMHPENEEECGKDSDELESFDGNDLEDEVGRRKTFPSYRDTEDPKWTDGMVFTDHKQCRQAIMKHSVSEGRVIKFVKSDRTRVKAVCKAPCQWSLFTSLNFNKTMQMKKVGPGKF